MNRSKSAGAILLTSNKPVNEEIRALCRRVAPYIIRRWREVCEELGVTGSTLDSLEVQYKNNRKSELAYQGLHKWVETSGRAARKDKLLRVVTALGLKRAEDEIRYDEEKRTVPFMGRPETAVTSENTVNRHAKQRALADRLSRPKSTASSDQDNRKSSAKASKVMVTGRNPLSLQITPVKPGALCEVKLKITVKGILKLNKDEMESTRDDFKSTKDDYKHTCHTFVKQAMARQKHHFRQLRNLLGFGGISIQNLSKLGFNINVFIMCHNLGAFENLNQSYSTGRLQKIIHRVFVTRECLSALDARDLELSVDMEEGAVHYCREVLLQREDLVLEDQHPVDELDHFRCDTDDNSDDEWESEQGVSEQLNVQNWTEEVACGIKELENRCSEFDDSMKDFIMALRILRPSDTREVTCLQDVLDCYQRLRNSQSVGGGVRTDLVREYIAIVNLIRIKMLRISDKDLHISFDESMPSNECETFHKMLYKLGDMLEPQYKFEADGNRTLEKHSLTGMEQEMFGGLINYLPSLIKQLYSVVNSLRQQNDARDDSTEDNKFSVHDELNEENKENIVRNGPVNLDHTCKLCAGKTRIERTKPAIVQETSVHYIETWTPG